MPLGADGLRQRARSPKPHPFLALDRQSLPRTLTDQPALKLREDRQDGDHRLARARGLAPGDRRFDRLLGASSVLPEPSLRLVAGEYSPSPPVC